MKNNKIIYVLMAVILLEGTLLYCVVRSMNKEKKQESEITETQQASIKEESDGSFSVTLNGKSHTITMKENSVQEWGTTFETYDIYFDNQKTISEINPITEKDFAILKGADDKDYIAVLANYTIGAPGKRYFVLDSDGKIVTTVMKGSSDGVYQVYNSDGCYYNYGGCMDLDLAKIQDNTIYFYTPYKTIQDQKTDTRDSNFYEQKLVIQNSQVSWELVKQF